MTSTPNEPISKLIDHIRKMRDLYSDMREEGLSYITSSYYTGKTHAYNEMIDYLTKQITQGDS